MTAAAGRIGITMGDPAGVGPEIICKALAEMPAEQRQRIVVFGDASRLEEAARIVGARLDFSGGPEGVATVDIPVGGARLEFGKLDPRAGDASFRFIEAAVRAALARDIACIVTAPINKAALNMAGHHYDGHTGMLAALTGTKRSFMLLADPRIATIHVSTHVSLSDAIGRVKRERVLETVLAGDGHLKRTGNAAPRIAVAGLNPHSGEGGLFGKEDDAEILPAVEEARRMGLNVSGPVPPDAVFRRCFMGEFDLVVAQYHDQGHIPMKMVAFDTTVNVTVGLPIDRTSVDHGTAFDIAGTGKADHINMNAAIAYARKLANATK